MLNTKDYFVYGIDKSRKIVENTERPNRGDAIARADRMILSNPEVVAVYVLDSAGSSEYRIEPVGGF